MTARVETWQAIAVAYRAIDSAVPAGAALARMESGQLAPAWSRALVLGYAVGRGAITESDARGLLDSPPAPAKRRIG